MDRWNVFALIVKALMVTLSCIGFMFQVKVQFSKFVRGDTTLTTRDIGVPSLKYPVITLCPDIGFKRQVLKDLGLSYNFWVLGSSVTGAEWVFNKTIQEWNNLSDATTYQIDDILNIMVLHQQTSSIAIELQDNNIITIQKIITGGHGACYSIRINIPTNKSTDYVQVGLNNSDDLEKINVFFHNDLTESYLNGYDYWLTQPNMIVSERNYKYNLEFTIKHSILDPEKRSCDVSGTTKSTHNCIIKKMVNRCQPCLFPFFSTILENRELKNNQSVCESREAVVTSYNCVFSAIFDGRDSCKTPCNVWNYDLSYRKIALLGKQGNSSHLSFYFKHLEVEEQKEYVLFDLEAILAAVGGSMGMFLGFSFLDFGLKIMAKLDKCIKQKVRPCGSI